MSRSPTPTRTWTKPSKFSVRRSRLSPPAPEVGPPPYPAWGAMLSGSGRTYMFRAVDGDLARRRDLTRGVRVQHARRRAARHPRPPAAWRSAVIGRGANRARQALTNPGERSTEELR